MIKYKNRLWVENDGVFELHFTHLEKDEILLKFYQDENDHNKYNYTSDFLSVEINDEYADDAGEAMSIFEDMVEEKMEDLAYLHEERLESWSEQDVATV